MDDKFVKHPAYLKVISKELLEAMRTLDISEKGSEQYVQAKTLIEDRICKIDRVSYYASLGIIIGDKQELVSKEEMKQHLQNVLTDLFLKNTISEEIFLKFLEHLDNEDSFNANTNQ